MSNINIGASDIPCLYNTDRFKTIHDLWNMKKGLVPKPEPTRYTELGKMLEGVIFESFLKNIDKTGKRNTVLFNHAEIQNFVCIPDGFVEIDGLNHLVEIKYTTTLEPNFFAYELQIFAMLEILDSMSTSSFNREYAYLVLSTPDHLSGKSENPFDVYAVYYRDMPRDLLKRVKEFNKSLFLDENPYPKQINISRLEEVNEPIILSDSVDDLCKDYNELGATISELEKRKKIVSKKIEEKCEGKDYLRTKNYGIKCITVKPSPELVIDVSFEDLLKKHGISYELGGKKGYSFYKITPIKEKIKDKED